MSDNNKFLTLTPLKNSNLANKPFRSPFGNNPSPSGNLSLKKCGTLPPSVSKTPKRQLPYKPSIRKHRRLDIENHENTETLEILEPTKNDLFALKQRIRSKRQEIDSLKIKLTYQKKHKKEDLQEQIEKWQQACQKALIQYQKDCNKNYPERGKIEMSDILINLGIPRDIVNFPKDEDI